MHGQGIMKGADGEVIFEGIWDQGKSKTARADLPEVEQCFLFCSLSTNIIVL